MTLVITPGEPAGIGPDIVLMLAARGRRIPAVVIADPGLLEERAAALGIDVVLEDWEPGTDAVLGEHRLTLLPQPLARPARAATPDPGNAPALLAALDRAVDGCLAGEFAALVTGPLHKAVINDAGIPFSGHTEYLAERTGGRPVMMLVAGWLRVALATTHLPLREVPDAITADRLERVLTVLHHDLTSRFGIESPRIRVLGLNPHAGEGGHMGREEIDIIAPVIERLRANGMSLSGPVPADTAFTPDSLPGCDAVLAMYHDQGLPVLKHAGFGEAVNCTLGLPIVRTSVDHGTALSLAGTGAAECSSLQSAIDVAIHMTRSR